jgi:hypothetical protein
MFDDNHDQETIPTTISIVGSEGAFIMNKLLLFSTSSEISHYERFAQKCGINLCTLDCFLDMHHLSTSPYVSERIVVKSHRFDVQRAIAQQNAASILIDACENTMRAALVVQAARDADVPFIAVVTSEENQQSVFRRLGAHAVIVAKTGQQTFQLYIRGN